MRAAISKDPSKAANLLRLSLELAEVMVLGGFLKLSVVEARMKMEPGGVDRQGLRLGKEDELLCLEVSFTMFVNLFPSLG